MADALQSQTMVRFLGLNSVDDATRLIPTVINHEYAYPLQQANNIDIDNTYAVSSRSGYDDVLTGTSIHSLWSDGDICLFVDGTTLKELGTGYTTISLRSGLTASSRMSYASWNDRIYYTNNYEIGYVKSSASNLLIDPLLEFKLPLPAGKFIEYYKGRLYLAKGKILYISDPLCDYYDVRSGYKQFASDITMLRAVDSGLYIGDSKVWWIKGDTPDEFDRVEAYSRVPIPYTDILTNGQNVGDGSKGNIAIWTGENGICMGDNDGTVSNLTESRYTLTPSVSGSGFIRENANVRHYINSLY